MLHAGQAVALSPAEILPQGKGSQCLETLISVGEEVSSPLESREKRPGMSYEAQDGPEHRMM